MKKLARNILMDYSSSINNGWLTVIYKVADGSIVETVDSGINECLEPASDAPGSISTQTWPNSPKHKEIQYKDFILKNILKLKLLL